MDAVIKFLGSLYKWRILNQRTMFFVLCNLFKFSSGYIFICTFTKLRTGDKTLFSVCEQWYQRSETSYLE